MIIILKEDIEVTRDEEDTEVRRAPFYAGSGIGDFITYR